MKCGLKPNDVGGSCSSGVSTAFKTGDKSLECVTHRAPERMRGASYPTLSARSSRKNKATTPSSPDGGNHKSPAVAWKVASPHLKRTSRARCLQHRRRRSRLSDRIRFAGYMRGDIGAPPEEVSVRTVGGAWSYSHRKIEYQKVVINSRDETTLVRLLWSGMTPRTS